MNADPSTIVSSTDYARLQGLMCTMIGSRTPLATLLRRKLGSAVIKGPPAAGPNLASTGRRVRFSVNGGTPQERTLAWEMSKRGDASTLSVQVPRGLAILGLSVGESITYETDSGSKEVLHVDQVYPEDGPFLGREQRRREGVLDLMEAR